jgi:arylsulfatase A
MNLLSRLFTISSGVVAILVSVAPSFAEVDHQNRLPNIVLIYADDLGWGDVNANNPDGCKIPTPHMDRVAAEGLTLTDMHSASAVCSPSRYALLTGRYSWRSRLQRSIAYPNMDYLIDPQRLTLPEMLNKQGYYSGIIGKWHLGTEYDRAVDKELPVGPIDDGRQISKGPRTQGFDYFYGAYTNGETIMIENDREVLKLPKLEDVLPLHTRKAVEFIERHGGSKISNRRVPFFLYFAMTSPHSPLVPSKEWKGKTGMGDYVDFVAETDHSIGKVLAAIEQVGIENDTIVIVTSDNGAPRNFVLPLHKKYGHSANGPFRGHKGDIWEGGHRVPCFIKWPGVIRPGRTSAALTCQTDFMSTLAEMAGIHLADDAGEDSISFLPVLKGSETGLRTDLVSHSFEGRFAIRKGEWKLIFAPGSGAWSAPQDPQAAASGMPPLQLYNMKTDPSEKANLQANYPSAVWHLTEVLEQQIDVGRSTPGKPQTNDVTVDYRHISKDYPQTSK